MTCVCVCVFISINISCTTTLHFRGQVCVVRVPVRALETGSPDAIRHIGHGHTTTGFTLGIRVFQYPTDNRLITTRDTTIRFSTQYHRTAIGSGSPLQIDVTVGTGLYTRHSPSYSGILSSSGFSHSLVIARQFSLKIVLFTRSYCSRVASHDETKRRDGSTR